MQKYINSVLIKFKTKEWKTRLGAKLSLSALNKPYCSLTAIWRNAHAKIYSRLDKGLPKLHSVYKSLILGRHTHIWIKDIYFFFQNLYGVVSIRQMGRGGGRIKLCQIWNLQLKSKGRLLARGDIFLLWESIVCICVICPLILAIWLF